MQESDNEFKLTIIHINDVYELENFSKLATCKEIHSQFNKTIVILAGDFLSPSLLSSIDKGNGIIDCMNESGVDFVCLGNHESDINIDFLYQRIKQSKFEWINSNIPDFILKEKYTNFISEYKIIEVYNRTKTKFKKIALLGMCCDDMSTMANGSFSKFTIENINKKTKLLYDHLINTEEVDLVIPITHQDIELDRNLAIMNKNCQLMPLMPLILGGHDHDEFFENIYGCQILKVGLNANKFGICSIIWDNDNITKPKINIEIKNASNYINDKKLDEIINNHKSILLDLQKCNIYKIPENITLSSKDVRYKQTTIGTFYSTIIKKELNLECVFLNAGFIRGDYDLTGEYFTYADLIKTIPFDNNIIIIELSGELIQEIINDTRKYAFSEPKIESKSFSQVDDGVLFVHNSNKIININNELIDINKLYKCGILQHSITGADNIKPLLNYIGSLPDADQKHYKNNDTGFDFKNIFLSYFSKNIFWNKIKLLGFAKIDKDNDGVLSKIELLNTISTEQNNKINEILIDNFFNVIDTDDNGKISQDELKELEKLGEVTIKYC